MKFFILVLSFIGIMLLIYAHYPEFRHYYRKSKLLSKPKYYDAETARQLTDMSIQYSSNKHCILFRHLFLKKSIYITIAYGIMILSLFFIIATCPVEMPILLFTILGSYIWVTFSCYLLLRFIRHTRMHVGLSILMAIIIPPCIYFLFYALLNQTRHHF